LKTGSADSREKRKEGKGRHYQLFCLLQLPREEKKKERKKKGEERGSTDVGDSVEEKEGETVMTRDSVKTKEKERKGCAVTISPLEKKGEKGEKGKKKSWYAMLAGQPERGAFGKKRKEKGY